MVLAIKKIVHQKLIEPLIHSKKPAIYKARGVAVGLGWAMTPLVGIQMFLVILTWGFLRKFHWHFSLPLALAWTWVTNVITLPPVYYVFYMTGQIMRFKFDNITGYESIKQLIENVFLADIPFMQQVESFLALLFVDWGVSMFLGCIPWIILSVILGYRLTLQFEQKRFERKERCK